MGDLSPWTAAQRLLRFIDTHAVVFGRIDDSGGHIQDAYWQALEDAPALVEQLTATDRSPRLGAQGVPARSGLCNHHRPCRGRINRLRNLDQVSLEARVDVKF
ncbi:hypothetical protein VZ95_07725 [Elstera litoralis]|uniref:Uncharacterized protein n=1 Tax=Elstera litoralis TaxID=552518 RepID=A0A0F3ITQ9_9PROT|nr:DUF6880 family protein [Elstera litoralis]KJV10012.1 hypothetical protein VZ95_07725 [Elstera litoralis]